MSEGLQILPVGGIGKVTQNMYVYQYQDEMLIVDCGIGFPDMYMPGVDAILPDKSFILNQLDKGKKIVGMILSHGHDDHIGALPYLLPDIPQKFPVFGSKLTSAFANQRLKDKGLPGIVQYVPDKKEIKLGSFFSFQFFHVTHSVPDTKHILINTPEGLVYHGTDFKLDHQPIDGKVSDEDFMASLKGKVKCMLLDCLRDEHDGWTGSESSVGPVLEKYVKETIGTVYITLMSSHIHRIQQVLDIAFKLNRKVAFVGMSVEKNVKIAHDLGELRFPKETVISKKKIKNYKDNELIVILSGSQGQEGSSLVRAVYGQHKVQIKPNDLVIFSAGAIPGNEIPYYSAIDELSRNGIKVVYPSVDEGLHQSGHASIDELVRVVSLVKPKYIMPIGGNDRHRARFKQVVAEPLGYKNNQILMPSVGEILELKDDKFYHKGTVDLHFTTIDGLGIGDVGPVVLNDRLILSKAGIIVIVLVKNKDKFLFDKTRIISRGFVFMQQADDIIEFLKKETQLYMMNNKELFNKNKPQMLRKLSDYISKKVYKLIQREPMVVPVIVKI